jgi:hypothetical protein
VDIDDTLLRNGVQPIERVIEYVNSLNGPIYIVTGRTTSQRAATVEALKNAGVNYDRLLMNPYAADQTLKWKQEIALRYSDAELAIDNDEDARAIYRAAGIPTKDPASI